MTFNMENRLRAIAIPGSIGILLLNVGLPEAARFLLSAELVSSLFAVLALCCVVVSLDLEDVAADNICIFRCCCLCLLK